MKKEKLITITISKLPTTTDTKDYEIECLYHLENKKIKKQFGMAISAHNPIKYTKITDMKPRLQRDLEKQIKNEKMADAKSRYEIVDGLVNQKSRIMTQIEELSAGEEQSRGNIEQQKRVNERQITDMVALHEVNKTTVKKKIEQLKEKMATFDEAINAIKAISSENKK